MKVHLFMWTSSSTPSRSLDPSDPKLPRLENLTLTHAWHITCETWCCKRNQPYRANLSHLKQKVCFSLTRLFSSLITICSFANRIVTHQGLKAWKKCFPAEMRLWAVIFQGFLASLLKLDPILQPFQCNWDTNPCHWSYQKPTRSMKKPHYVVIFLEEALWLHRERAACPSTCQKPPLRGSIIENIASYWPSELLTLLLLTAEEPNPTQRMHSDHIFFSISHAFFSL